MSEVLENLVKQDDEFSESKFKSKVENEFIQIMLSMVSRKTLPVRHFVNEEVYEKIINKIILFNLVFIHYIIKIQIL